MTLLSNPKKLIVVGSGAIESDLLYYSAMDEVTVVEFQDRIVPREDEEVSKALERNFKKAGINILTSAEIDSS